MTAQRSKAEVENLYWRAAELAREIISRNRPFGMFFDNWPEGRDKESCRRLWDACTIADTRQNSNEIKYNSLRDAIAYAEGQQ